MSSVDALSPFPTSEDFNVDGLESLSKTEDFLDNLFPISTQSPIQSTTEIISQILNLNMTTLKETVNATQKIDLQTLWKWLEQGGHSLNSEGQSGKGSTIGGVVGLNEANLHEIEAKTSATTWQLAIIQGVLLAMLVILSILWAFCCRKLRRGDQPLIAGITEQVVALARKISNGSQRDLPPSYSKVDLTQVGLTINDHFNPPPHYDVVTDEEMSGDSRRHRRRVSRFSLSSVEADAGLSLPPIRRLTDRVSIESDPRPDRFSISSETSEINRPSRFSISSSVSGCSCGGSDSESSSRRTSRVTFAPNLEAGPTRRESSQSLPLQPVLVKSRKSSSNSEGTANSRRVSFVDEITGKSARPDPLLEEKLRSQLEMVKEAGEMGEFVSASPTLANQPTAATIHSPPKTDIPALTPSTSLSTSQEEISSDKTETNPHSSTSPRTSTSTSTNQGGIGMKTKKKSFCHLPEDDIKNKELFI